MAAAPSDAGHASSRRTGSHTIGDSLTISSVMSFELEVGVRILQRVLAVLQRDHPADVLGRLRPLDVGADVRSEVAAGADAAAAAAAEAPRGVALRLLLEGDGEHLLVHAARDEVGGDDRGRAADAAGGVHAEDRLAVGTQRVGQVHLRHHQAFELVGRLADDDGVDVLPGHLGVVEGALTGLTDEARHRQVLADLGVLGLADADDCTTSPFSAPPVLRRGSVAGPGPTWRGRRRGSGRSG